MATLIPARTAKRQRLADEASARESQALAASGKHGPSSKSIVIQFRSGQDGEDLGNHILLPADTTAKQLELVVNRLRREFGKKAGEEEEEEEDVPYAFHVNLPDVAAQVGDDGGKVTSNQRIQIHKSIVEDVLSSWQSQKLGLSTEDVLQVIFQPQAVFRVRPVTRCSSTLSGHSSPILCSTFSPSSKLLCTGAGDKSARIWDIDSELPLHALTGHSGWVLCAEWEGRERRLATGDMSGDVWVWDAMDASDGKVGRRAWGAAARSKESVAAESAEQQQQQQEKDEEQKGRPTVAERRLARASGPKGRAFKGHTKWITSLAWEPIHRNTTSPRLASSSKDGTVRVWNVSNRTLCFALGGHSASVNVVRWGGEGALYTASSDRTVKVWNDQTGQLIRTLNDHAHWVNTLALSTDHTLRTGPFDHTGSFAKPSPSAVQAAQTRLKEQRARSAADIVGAPDAGQYTELDLAAQASAQTRYDASTSNNKFERAISGSDDHTLFLWPPQISGDVSLGAEGGATPKRPLSRFTGHQKTVNHVAFSPDARLIASASFDNSIKVWDGKTGKFVATLRGHVSSVYRIAWSADSRILVSASKDSTLKLWDLKTFKIRVDLPGHEDEVYCVDFAADKVVSGGRDRVVKIWRN
ncbi:putative RSA4-WD-repeat protein [Ceraceosorus guamensis]|uniref:Putative RSA4-WD-repeat protein n=1 Tax=Ceraceosorus guamensis TaxID=1522189 RepID=A0A316VPU6_9BASI|nr:putative RSA4-WD-repeat protein [Ceraceosorus guamensis]PWN39669.1 putative RSA4-WD-repeat protein [Ceraceosorus guamensis]